jgi:hypothetical protein
MVHKKDWGDSFGPQKSTSHCFQGVLRACSVVDLSARRKYFLLVRLRRPTHKKWIVVRQVWTAPTGSTHIVRARVLSDLDGLVMVC